MHKVRLLILACLALFAFGAFAAQAAMAEEKDPTVPKVLILTGEAKNVSDTFTGGETKLEAASGKSLKSATIEATLEGCKAEESSLLDFTLCGPILLDFHEVKTETGVECRSEMLNKEQKDPIGLVLVWVDFHLAAEKVGAELEPLALFKVLGALTGESPEELQMNCGGVVEKVKGVIACLLTPGLKDVATTEKLAILCKIKGTKTGEGEKGECELLCEWLTGNPFLANLGKGAEPAWMNVHAEGSPSQDVLIDD